MSRIAIVLLIYHRHKPIDLIIIIVCSVLAKVDTVIPTETFSFIDVTFLFCRR
jgi:hypothetical protein